VFVRVVEFDTKLLLLQDISNGDDVILRPTTGILHPFSVQ